MRNCKGQRQPQSDLPQLAERIAALDGTLLEDGPWKQPFGELGISLRDIIRGGDIAVAAAWQVVVCGMAPAPEDGVWLQSNDDGDSKSLLRCAPRHACLPR